MASGFTREHLKIGIAKICLTIGWHNTMTTPLEMLTDILYNYMYYLGKTTTDYAHQFGVTEANLEHLSLAFKDFRININDFTEYVNSVECPSKLMIPKYPLPKQDRLNFLKPGSKEVVSRQVHVYEHLPPMFPHLEEDQEQPAELSLENIESTTTITQEIDPKKRPRIIIGQSVRELSSVMMTTSGFLSPAREGKLPESRTPAIALEPSISPTEPFKKPAKMKKFFKMRREFFKQFSNHESLKKAMKIRKRKIKQRTAAKNYMIVSNKPVDSQKETPRPETVTKIIPETVSNKANNEPFVEKLFTKPSKRKNNILRKISVKNKQPKICKVDEPKRNVEGNFLAAVKDLDFLNNFPNDLTIHPINPPPQNNRKQKINILKKPKEKRDNLAVKMEETSTDGYLNTFNYPFNNISEVLPTKVVNKQKTNILKKISNRSRSSKKGMKQFSTDLTASIIKDAGVHHNICKDLIIEPIVSEKPIKLESYSNINLAPKIETHNHNTTITKVDPKLRSPKQFATPKYDFETNHPKAPEPPTIISQPTLPPLHFPFFNPFAGPGLIPSPLMNPLFPHLPIPPLGIPTFGQLPMPIPKTPLNKPIKTATLSKPPPPLIKTSPVALNKTEAENNSLDLTLKKKKRKKNKHKSDKKRKEKSDGNKSALKTEPKLISTDYTPPIRTSPPKSKRESSPPELYYYKKEMSPELAKFSALITGQPKQRSSSGSSKHSDSATTPVKRGRGRPRLHPVSQPKEEIWTCPICGNEDNGNPMICCDGCNTWYHWVCVGIQIPPEASEDWYCKHCISNNKSDYLESETKKGKEKKW